jgi:hypothetical protein
LLVVIHHATLWPIPGGAAVLVMLVGYSLARFKRRQLFAGDASGVLASLAAVLAPYALIIAGFSLVRGEVLWPSVFLIGNLGFVKPPHMLPYLYWFVEAYIQIMLLWVTLFCIPRIRHFAGARPFAFGAILLAASIAAKFLVPLVWNIGGPQIFTLPDVFYLTALGWCAYFANARWKRRTLALATILLCPLLAWYGGNWTGSWVKFTLVLGATLAVLYVPRVAVPTWAAQFLLPISAGSYHIYLFHRLVPEWLLPSLDPGAAQLLVSALAVLIGLVSGLAALTVQRWMLSVLSERQFQRKKYESLVTEP